MSDRYIINNERLMKEWDWEKNDKLGLLPSKIFLGSSKKVWWRCRICGNSWQATPGHRATNKKPTGCPQCSIKERIKNRKNRILLEENIAIKYPDLLKEWDYEKNKDISPFQISKGSHHSIWWKCKCGHSWSTSVGNRIKGHGCPYCSGRKAIKGKTDLLTINPRLAEEWNYEKNCSLTPDTITANSNKKVWWKCRVCGYEWQAPVNNRNQKRGCPLCAERRHISVPEKAIAFYLSKQYKVECNKKFDWLKNKELDIFIPELMLAIEYDGRAWHKKEERDLLKDKICYDNGVKLIRIREKGLKPYDTTAFLITTEEPTLDLLYLESVIKDIVAYIELNFAQECKIEIDLKKDYYTILALVKKQKINSSLACKHPELIKEWDFDKNNNLDPFSISVGSSIKVWWLCEKGHSWKTSIANRTSKHNLNKCPYCQGKKVIKGENDLVTINAAFLRDWNYEKNKLGPENYTISSGKKVWWKCYICGYEWEAVIASRNQSGCRKCLLAKIKEENCKPVENIDTGEIYSSATQAAKENNLYPGAVSRCCRGERKSAGGCHWRYIEK